MSDFGSIYLDKEKELMKAFDQESLIKLLDLFGENVAIG